MKISNDDTADFIGSKLAVICADNILVYRRDDFHWIPFPDHWDFPGGGREQDETPEQCALRELHEEFGLVFDESRIHYKRRVVSQTGDGFAYFLVIDVAQAELTGIAFGDEGQYWALMPIAQYLAEPSSIPANKERLLTYLRDS